MDVFGLRLAVLAALALLLEPSEWLRDDPFLDLSSAFNATPELRDACAAI
jgi:hypothetical protein